VPQTPKVMREPGSSDPAPSSQYAMKACPVRRHQPTGQLRGSAPVSGGIDGVRRTLGECLVEQLADLLVGLRGSLRLAFA
jgi:hypothetical protein